MMYRSLEISLSIAKDPKVEMSKEVIRSLLDNCIKRTDCLRVVCLITERIPSNSPGVEIPIEFRARHQLKRIVNETLPILLVGESQYRRYFTKVTHLLKYKASNR